MDNKHTKSIESADKNRPFSIGEEVQIFIDALSFGGGRGVGRINGYVIFVSNVAPNDTVIAKITKAKKRFAEASLVKVITPSPQRVLPKCPVAVECGGCKWQQVDYKEQLHQKSLIVSKALAKIQKQDLFTIAPIVPSPQQWRYRNRIQIHKKGSQVGFLQTRTKQIVPIQDCLIADPQLTDLFSKIAQETKKSDRIELALDKNGKVHSYSGKTPAHLSLFSQVNSLQNDYLVNYVKMTLSNLPNARRILDLYAGSGNFSHPMAKQNTESQIVAIEFSQTSVQLAKSTAPKNLNFIASDVGSYLQNCKSKFFDFTVLDPPRNGCDRLAISGLLSLNCQNLLYISCNPLTLARDLELLSPIYKVNSVQPIDMFPQTDHVETIVQLSLR